MNDLRIIMPDYDTRRDAFDALLKPKVPYDDDLYLSWEGAPGTGISET